MGEEKMRREIEPGIGDIPEKGIYGISPTIDGDLLEVDYVAPKKGGGITRHKFAVGTAATGGLLFLTGCVTPTETPVVRTPEEAGVTPTPTLKIETPTPTEEVIPPTPTVVQREIGTIPRELGGAESEIFGVSFEGETQQGILNKFPDGEQWFLLGVYPDLPGVEEKVDFTNEMVGYDGEVFLTAVPDLAEHPEARPFYQKEPEEGFPNGVLLYIEDGKIIAKVDPFTQFREGEVSVRFNSEKGVYEFLDEEENVKRTIEVFAVPEPTPTSEPTPTYTPEPTPTPKPIATPTPEIPTPTPTPEIQPSPEICDVTGLCHPRTERRKGMNPDGHVFPNGLCYRYTGDPDRHFQGTWVISGRIAEIVDYQDGTILLEVRDGNKIRITIEFGHERFYARLWTFQLGVLWNVSQPEVRPRLGWDILPGDYIQLTPYPPYEFAMRNDLTEEENYQRLIAANAQGARIIARTIEMLQ